MDINFLRSRETDRRMEKHSSLKDAMIDYDRNFVKNWRNIFREYRTCQKENRMWIAGPSSYVFVMEGMRFAVDLQIRREKDREILFLELERDLADLDFILITHEHDDHLCLPMMRALKDTHIHWYIPYNSHREWVEETGISMEHITWIRPDDCWQIGNIHFCAFHTPHTIPHHKIFTQCGYAISVPEFRLLIPGDIRDYEYEGYPDVGPIDLCIAHLWGGNNALDPESYLPFLEAFADRCASFDADRYFLCHLYEVGREELYLWDYAHAGIAMKLLYERKPECEVQMPRIGRSYALTGKETKHVL